MKRTILAAALCCAAAPALAQEPPAAEPGRVFEIAQVETMPRPLNVPELREALYSAYPAELRDAGRQGTVTVSLVVSPEGETRDVRVVSSTDAAFDSATVTAVRVLRFTPAAVEGRPVAVRVELPVQWQPAPPEPAPVAQADAPADSAAAGDRVYELKDVAEPPRPRNLAILRQLLERNYPARLAHAGQNGEVHVRFRVDAQGDVKDPRIVSATHVDFNQPTLEVVRHLKFTPASVGGRPVQVWAELPIRWTAPISPGNRLP